MSNEQTIFETELGVELSKGCAPGLRMADDSTYLTGKAVLRWTVEFCTRSYGIAYMRPEILGKTLLVTYQGYDAEGNAEGRHEATVELKRVVCEFSGNEHGDEPGLQATSLEIDADGVATVSFQTVSC